MLLDELEDCFYDKYGRSHKGVLVFVLEKDFDRLNTLGYSQNSPLRSQGTIIFKGGIILSDVYSHELGHFLGLEHTFLKEQNANKINTSIITKKNNDIQRLYFHKHQISTMREEVKSFYK